MTIRESINLARQLALTFDFWGFGLYDIALELRNAYRAGDECIACSACYRLHAKYAGTA